MRAARKFAEIKVKNKNAPSGAQAENGKGERCTEMNEMENLQQAMKKQILNLKPAPEPTAEEIPFQDLYLDGTEPDNSHWRALLEQYLA